MNLREYIYSVSGVELPTTEPLWNPKQGLQGMVNDGRVNQLPVAIGKRFFIPPTTEQEKRKILFDSMIVKKNILDLRGNILVADVPGEVNKKVSKIFSNRNRYQRVSGMFPNPIKWYHVGLIHEMECSQNFNCYLGNGQPWNKKTTIVPKGRGPFTSFEKGAYDAIIYDKLNEIQDWSVGNALYILEGFNGYGYSLYRGINSPYIWSGSDQYMSGKYIADGVYSKTAVSSQIGIALLLNEILNRL